MGGMYPAPGVGPIRNTKDAKNARGQQDLEVEKLRASKQRWKEVRRRVGARVRSWFGRG